MPIVTGTFTVPPENVAPFRPYMATMAALSRAERGCEHYAYMPDPQTPGRFHLIELWATPRDFDAHKRTAHMRQWRASWQAFGVESPGLTVHPFGHRAEAVATVEPCGSFTAVYALALDGEPADHIARCLTHGIERVQGSLDDAKAAALAPYRWCRDCLDAHPLLSQAAVVVLAFDATGIPEPHAGAVAIPARRLADPL